MVMTFQRIILNTIKFHNGLRSTYSFSPYYQTFMQDVDLQITFSQELTQQEQGDLTAFVTNFVDYTTADQLAVYLENSVRPFISNLMNQFAAENISMGVTQAGKTSYVLGLYAKKYPVPSGNTSLPISLKDCFDSGSLYSALDVIQYIRDNSSEYSGLDPFVTDARLLSMKNKIELFLGVPLSS